MGNVISLSDHQSAGLPEWARPFRRWGEAMAHVDFANAASSVAWHAYKSAIEDFDRDTEVANRLYAEYCDRYIPRVIAVSRAMMTPAPDLKALKWKRRCRRMEGGHPFWENAIEADSRRLEKQGDAP